MTGVRPVHGILASIMQITPIDHRKKSNIQATKYTDETEIIPVSQSAKRNRGKEGKCK